MLKWVLQLFKGKKEESMTSFSLEIRKKRHHKRQNRNSPRRRAIRATKGSKKVNQPASILEKRSHSFFDDKELENCSESPKVTKQLKIDHLDISQSTCAFNSQVTNKEPDRINPFIQQDLLFPEKKQVKLTHHQSPWPSEILIEKQRRWQEPSSGIEILRERSPNIARPVATNRYKVERNEETENFQSQIILKVFQGHVEYQIAANNVIKLDSCEFQTNENYKSIIKFPRMGNEIHFQEKVHKLQCMNSIEQLLNNKSPLDSRNKGILIGWVLGSLNEEKKFQELAQDLKKFKNVALLDYTKNATLYVLHPDLIEKEKRDEWDWFPKFVGSGNQKGEHLLWAICLKDEIIRNSIPIEPEYIGVSGSVQMDNYIF